jgi:hypothetical protein
MKGYLYEKKKVEKLIDDQDRAFIHHKKEIGSYKRIEGYTVNQSRIPKRQLCSKADVAQVIEKGADSLSKVDGLKSSAQILTEVGRIKRRRESEYQQGVAKVNETSTSSPLCKEEEDMKAIWDRRKEGSQIDKLQKLLKIEPMTKKQLALNGINITPNFDRYNPSHWQCKAVERNEDDKFILTAMAQKILK